MVLNSMLVTVLALVLTLVLAIPAAFAIARAEGRLGALVERVFSLGFLIPTFAALFPTFLLSAATGLFHTRAFMVLFLLYDGDAVVRRHPGAVHADHPA